MAIVKAPALSLEASGNLGSINYTRWRGLAIARTTYIPSYTPSQKQLDQRASMTLIAAKWGDALSGEDRLQWERAVEDLVVMNRMGGVYRPSGYQHFMRVNLLADFFGGGVQFVPPKLPNSVYVWRFRGGPSGTVEENLVFMEKALNVPPVSDGWEIYRAGPYASGGRRPIKPEYRHLAVERVSHRYRDSDVIDTKWYWYKARWFFDVGFVGNWWEIQIQTDFP